MRKGLHILAIGPLLTLCGPCHSQQETVRYFYTDQNNNVLAETDASGNSIAAYDYAPYGGTVANMSQPPDGPGYSGHVNDADTGLIYMQARYFDPMVGRFLSTDPDAPAAGNVFNQSRYAYANNNPIMNTDPTGKVIQIAGDASFTQHAKDYIATISQGPGGRALVVQLQNTPNVVYVVSRAAGAGNSTQADPSGTSANGKGTGSTVSVDVTSTTGGIDATGSTSRPEYVGAAHEFGHARAIDQGTQSYDKGNKAPGTTPPSEVQSMADENMVRQEHNLPVRPSYYNPTPPPKTPLPPPPPPTIH